LGDEPTAGDRSDGGAYDYRNNTTGFISAGVNTRAQGGFVVDTAARPIGDIGLGLAAVGGQRLHAVAMIRAAIVDDIVTQAAALTEHGESVDAALAQVVAWWSSVALESIAEGGRRARGAAA
jgi:hypothetical protein